MRFTIIGAGTIGLTYGHLLSRVHDVDYVVPDGRRSAYEGSFHLHLHDLRDGTDSVREFTPRLLSDVSASEADAILVMAPGDRLPELLPHLASSAPPHIPLVLMLNRWGLEREARLHLPRSRFHLGFPSQVGGGRQGRHVHATVFRTGTVLETGHAAGRRVMDAIEEAFRAAGLSVARERRMSDWLRIHCLQQSLTARPAVALSAVPPPGTGRRAPHAGHVRRCRCAHDGHPPQRARDTGMDLGLPRHPRLSDGGGAEHADARPPSPRPRSMRAGSRRPGP